MKRRLVSAVIAAIICFTLCGCDFFTSNTAELLSPPELSGDISPIAEAIAKSAGGEYTLKYPSDGNFRSAVVQNDIDSDGRLEAFAFYSMKEKENGAETVNMYISVITLNDGKWLCADKQKVVAGGVERIDFCDLDGDGILEILVGWEIYGTSEMQLAVYSFKNQKLTQRTMQRYSRFVCCDLDEDGLNEILIIKSNAAEQLNTAGIYRLTESGVTELYSCELDKTVQSVGEPVVSHLSSGRPAVYIDEIKGIGAITEVLFIEKNQLVNPLMNTESRETLATLRSADIGVKDINDDGIIEIPVQENVPSLTKSNLNEKLYLTNWCSYNGEALTNQMTAMINSNDGYYYILSQKWADQIAVLKDTDKRLREIYLYDSETQAAIEMLVSFMTVSRVDWESGKFAETGYEIITKNEVYVYLCKISDTAQSQGLTLDVISKNFKLTE